MTADRLETPEEGDISLAASPFSPRTLSAATRATYIVKLNGNPVALAQEAAGRKLSASEKQAVRDQLAATQASLEPQIQALGGVVLARFRDSYNGMRVRIDRAQLGALASLHGVVKVSPARLYQPTNTNGVPRISAPGAWVPFASGTGFRGEGVKVAIIDTGIDYTHRDFGGPGTADAYAAALATDTQPADPALFGPLASKVKGGIDLAGDGYDGGSDDPAVATPHPDLNPLDCNGHGTHVAGTAAGFGVLHGGAQFNGPYDATTYSANAFEVGPGVAPRADIYSIRVFGCEGSTNLVVEALDWAVANDMDVVNMSLGSSFGGSDDADAEASDNAVKAGVAVIASAGNSGAIRFITGSPASASSVVSVAAQDPTPSFPAATISSGSTTINAINANGAPITAGALTVQVLRNANGTISLGCDPAEYVNANVTGKLVVVTRGVCARVARAVFGQQAGAAAVLMINNATVFPPFEGEITSNPDTGEAYTVTIPFLGVPSTSGNAIAALDGRSVNIAAATLPNTGFNTIASFSSLGPRLNDAHLKPDVTAPGVSIRSAGMGSGVQGAVLSGTSMASPHVAGLAALARQAHPSWSAARIKQAIMNTASPADVVAYQTARAGTGLVNAANAAHTNAVAWADANEVTLNFGAIELNSDFSVTKTIRVRNEGASSVTFSVGAENAQGSPHSVAVSAATLAAPANQTVSVNVTVTIPAATAGASNAFREVAGVVTFTPASGGNAGVALRVPYYAVVRPSSSVKTQISPRLSSSRPNANATVTNNGGTINGNADFYAWGLSDGNDQSAGYVDIRAVGAQSFAASAGRSTIVFAVNMNQMWTSPNLLDVELPIDTNADGNADYVVIGADIGLLTTGTFDGRMASGVLNVATGAISISFLASAPAASSTILLPVSTTQLGMTAAGPRLVYSAAAFDLNGPAQDSVNAAAAFNAYSNAISTGAFVSVAPGASVQVPLSLNLAEWAVTPALGTMVVTTDNKSGASEADLISVSP